MKNNIVSKIWIKLSLIVALLVFYTSVMGIFNLATYEQETKNWALQAVGQDIANLAVVLILLISTFFLAKGSIRAYLVWLGTYFYLIYAFVIYTFSVHFNYLFLAYIAIFSLSIFIPVGSIVNGSISFLTKSFNAKIQVKPASILLMIIGVMFSLLWLIEIIPYSFSGTRPQSLIDTGLWTNPVHVLDLGLLLPTMIITSVLLWHRQFLGYFLAIPLLIFSATMGLGILILFILIANNDGVSIAPPAYFIGLLIFFSAFFAYRFLKKIKQ